MGDEGAALTHCVEGYKVMCKGEGVILIYWCASCKTRLNSHTSLYLLNKFISIVS